jgi:hypothetical protein
MSQLTSIGTFPDGKYQITVIIGTGTASLQMTTKDHGAQAIPNASWSASVIKFISVPDCQLTPVLTGDAELFIVPKRSV